MEIDLHRFCDPAERLYDLSKPWTDGKYDYASTGFILIRLPASGDYLPGNEKLIEDTTILFKNTTTALEQIPTLPESAICGECKGVGFVSYTDCPECDGDAYLKFENEHNFYTVECKTCAGEGEVQVLLEQGKKKKLCGSCRGSGKKFKKNRVKIGPALFYPNVLSFIVDLPNVAIAVNSGDKPALITFDGGDGIVMPRCEQLKAP